jgi:hypothetical protein
VHNQTSGIEITSLDILVLDGAILLWNLDSFEDHRKLIDVNLKHI